MHEQRISRHTIDEQALQVIHEPQLRGRGGDRGSYRGRGRGRGRFQFDKTTLECYNYHELGHFQWECQKRTRDTRVNFVETSEDMLLMAYMDDNETERDHLWFLDSRCSNPHVWEKRVILTV